MTDLPLIEDLNHAQADGRACVVCGFDYLTAPAGTRSVPVGRSVTGSQVMACAPPKRCAERAGWRPPTGWRQDVLSEPRHILARLDAMARDHLGEEL